MSEGPRVVEAAGISVNTLAIDRRARVKYIEQAMADAVMYANKRGITNPDVIRAMIQKARLEAKHRLWPLYTSATPQTK